MARALRPLLPLLCALAGTAAAREPNYDEAKVAPYVLPDPFVAANGARLKSPDQWPARRAEILALFQDQMYGVVPPPPAHLRLDTFESGETLDGRVVRKQVHMTFRPDGSGPAIDWIIFLPKDAKGPVPAFVGLNFHGNQEILPDPAIRVTTGWLRDDAKHFTAGRRASERSRGLTVAPGASQTWPVGLLAARGYALVTACYGEVAPDDKDAYTNGVFALFPPATPGVGSNTTALAAWAWGLMRGMDLIAREPAIDARRVAAVGCSRLGKTALLAGALDERFAVVIPNQTGEGGVPLSKRDYGENLSTENRMFPHWFCGNYRQYVDNEAALPFDQHWLLACVAPRRLYVSSFPGKWFDPYGEFLSVKAAEPVWKFLGLPGLPADQWPAELSPVASSHLGYHRRPGEHGIARYDWQCYLAFTDRAFGQRIDWSPDQTDNWHGFTRHRFALDGCTCWVVEPKSPRPGNPWVWCTEWPDAFTDRTGTERLLADGFHYIHMEVGTMCLGSPAALAHMDALYRRLVDKGLSAKGTFTGISRGGLYAYRFAAAHPERVVCVYGDAPVCDLKSWPLGAGAGTRDEKGVKLLLGLYGFKDETEALAYKGNPVDSLEPLAKAGIPLIHVVGDADTVVPPASNTDVIEQRYKALGGTVTVFHKPGVGHHPHGLDDPAPLVRLIEDYTTRGDAEACR